LKKKDMSHGIRYSSNARAKQVREYIKLKRAFFEEHPYCQVCPEIFRNKRRHYANDIHHTRGKVGTLLNDTNHWLATCREGHDWIHSHIGLAREAGLIAPLGEWNKTARTSHLRREE